MDLEVVGRHALLFNDDAAAAFVNSGDALVDWHSLQIDRYDVRHLLSSPPPPRRPNRNSKPVFLDDSSLESQLDHERYLDLPSHPDQPDVEEDDHRTDALGYRAVAFSYGYTDESADKKNADAGMESSGFLPRFPIPKDLLQSLVVVHWHFVPFDAMTRALQPPTEKVHQIIARTALFVSKHGGQSEIILRVKQGDNPTFGFLMPGHHLHAYFRFLVEHQELLHSESDGKFQDEQKKSASDHTESNGVNGALTLLGSVYGSGEEDEGDDIVKPEKDVSHNSIYSLNRSISHSSKKIESQADAAKDEPVSKNPILSNREKVLTVKKNSLITTSKSGIAKGMEEKSRLFSGVADKAKSLTMGMTSKIEPVTLEPPPELKRLIDKLVELIMRNGKQFESTLIEQDSEHGRFPFLLPSNQYHSYYLKVIQTAHESKLNCKGFNSGKDDLLGRRVDKKASVPEEKDSSSLVSDMPLESDRKEKFKMVIGKSKKETQEAESKEAQQECGIDAAAAAAILQAATRGINNSNLQTISITSSSAHVHVNNSEGGQPRDVGNPLSSKPDNAVEADSEAHLTKEQKLKAERLKRAKMFVAMLKSGEVPFTAGTSRGSSLEPLESGVLRSAGEVNLDCKKREASLAPPDVDGPATGEKPEKNYFGEHNERLSKRKYRSRSGVCEDDEEDDGDKNEHNGRHSKRKCRSRSRRHDEGGENDNAIERERKHHRRRHRTHSSSDKDEDEGESNEEDRDHKHYKMKHRSHDQQVDECDDKYKEDKNHKRTRKKHHRRRHQTRSYSDESEDEGESSEEGRDHKRYKSKHRSHSQEEDELEDKYKEDKNHKHTRKKHRSHSRKRRSSEQDDDYEIDEKRFGRRHRSSHGSRDKHRHSHRDRESQYNLKSDTSSGDEHQNRSGMDKYNNNKRNELEEGEVSSRVSEESRGIASGDISLEASTDVLSSLQRAPSLPSETSADVPGDLRAKIRAMLMSTRL